MAKGFLYDEGDALITRKEDVGGLPDPEEASAGDVLTLDEDKEPVWSEPPGGLGFTVSTTQETITIGGSSLDVNATNITTADMKNAIDNGDFICEKVSFEGGIGIGVVAQILYRVTDGVYQFLGSGYSSGGYEEFMFVGEANGTLYKVVPQN